MKDKWFRGPAEVGYIAIRPSIGLAPAAPRNVFNGNVNVITQASYGSSNGVNASSGTVSSAASELGVHAEITGKSPSYHAPSAVPLYHAPPTVPSYHVPHTVPSCDETSDLYTLHDCLIPQILSIHSDHVLFVLILHRLFKESRTSKC